MQVYTSRKVTRTRTMQLLMVHTDNPCQHMYKAIFVLVQLVFKLVQLELVFMFK